MIMPFGLLGLNKNIPQILIYLTQIHSPPWLKVADLINNDRSWNLNKLKMLFDSNTINHIQNIHLSLQPSLDSSVWTTSPGIFSVKYGHQLQVNQSQNHIGPLSAVEWKNLWNIKLQHRLRACLRLQKKKKVCCKQKTGNGSNNDSNEPIIEYFAILTNFPCREGS